MGKITYDSALQDMGASKATIKCRELVKILTSLGYDVDKAKSGNHYTFTNGKIAYYGGNFDCGHGKNPVLLPRYIDKIIKILAAHSDDAKDTETLPGKMK